MGLFSKKSNANTSNPLEVAAAQQQTSQAKTDGLPQYVIYRQPNSFGIRSTGHSQMAQPVGQTGGPGVLGPAGFISGSPQDPAVPPVEVMPYSAMGAPRALDLPDQKLMWETSQYVPGKGWVNSTTTNS